MIFTPCPGPCPAGEGWQNTDPFVFGERFLYSCCKQLRHNGTATYLRELQRGDVILFGSHQHGAFVLDTVLVVAESLLFQPRAGVHALHGRVSEEFVEATLRPLERAFTGPQDIHGERDARCIGVRDWQQDDEAASCTPSPCDADAQLRLYWGATRHAPVDGMFSFAPARVLARSPAGQVDPIP
jgi:hypothetical protein